MIELSIILALAAVALVVLTLVKAVRIIPQARAANVERLGRYRRTLDAGLNFVVPFLDPDLRQSAVVTTQSL